jgi:putative transposase
MTHVTDRRVPWLVDHADLLEQAIEKAGLEWGMQLQAWVILPDHFHILANFGEKNPSNVVRRIKLSFSANLRKRLRATSGRIWQYRFWDHIIRDQRDWKRHVDYLHYNPVKHGHVMRPGDWRYTSFPDFVSEGYYQGDWGMKEIRDLEGDYGE